MIEFIIIFGVIVVAILYISSQLPDQNETLMNNIKKFDANGTTKNKGKG